MVQMWVGSTRNMSWNDIIILRVLVMCLVSQGYTKACDEYCMTNLTQTFEAILASKLEPITRELGEIRSDLDFVKRNTQGMDNIMANIGQNSSLSSDSLQYIKEETKQLQDSLDNISNSIAEIEKSHNSSATNIEKTLKDVGKCPEDFFKSPGSSQCFIPLLNQKRTWKDADTKCKNMTLTLAKPYNAVELTKYIVERFGKYHYWLGARGNGVAMVWQDDQQRILDDSPLWRPGPAKRISKDACLTLFASNSNIKETPVKPYGSSDCNDSHTYALCEKV